MLRVIPLAIVLGCGTVLRAEGGPSWLEGGGTGATLQAMIGGSPVAGAGIHELLLVGGYGTWTSGGLSGGLLVGIELGVAPGGLGSGDRGGLGGAARTLPRLRFGEADLGAGLALTWGHGERIDSGGFDLYEHEKGGFGFDWDVRRWWNVRLAVDVQRTFADERAGPWRVDALLGVERLVLTD